MGDLAQALLEYNLRRHRLTRVQTLPTPAAGAQLIRKIAGGQSERLISLEFLYTASAAVANRNVLLEYRDQDNNRFLTIPATASITANGSNLFSFFVGGPAPYSGLSGILPFPLPDLILQPGYSWQTNVVGIDVADTITEPRVTIEEFPSGPAGYPSAFRSDLYTESEGEGI